MAVPSARTMAMRSSGSPRSVQRSRAGLPRLVPRPESDSGVPTSQSCSNMLRVARVGQDGMRSGLSKKGWRSRSSSDATFCRSLRSAQGSISQAKRDQHTNVKWRKAPREGVGAAKRKNRVQFLLTREHLMQALPIPTSRVAGADIPIVHMAETLAHAATALTAHTNSDQLRRPPQPPCAGGLTQPPSVFRWHCESGSEGDRWISLRERNFCRASSLLPSVSVGFIERSILALRS